MKISILTVIFDHRTWKSIENIYSLGVTTVQQFDLDLWQSDLKINNIFLGSSTVPNQTIKQRGQKIFWRTSFEQRHLTMWPDNLRPRGIHCTKFSNSLAKGQTTLSEHHLYKDQKFDLDLWPCNLNVDSEHLLSRNIHCNKLGFFLGGGHKNPMLIKRAVSY